VPIYLPENKMQCEIFFPMDFSATFEIFLTPFKRLHRIIAKHCLFGRERNDVTKSLKKIAK
jgi:hypothetical protein